MRSKRQKNRTDINILKNENIIINENEIRNGAVHGKSRSFDESGERWKMSIRSLTGSVDARALIVE